MNTPDFKTIVEKIKAFKNTSGLMTPIVIALVGIILFIPAQIMSGRIREQIQQESVSVGRRIGSIEAVPEDQWQEVAKAQESFAQDANQAAQMALQTTQRELLSYRIFPEPPGTSQLVFEQYAQAYRGGIDAMLAGLKSTNAPTEAEIKTHLEQAKTSGTRRRGYYGGGMSYRLPSGFGRGLSGRLGRLSETDMTIIDLVCTERAEGAGFYATVEDITGYDFWGQFEYTGLDDALKSTWYHQLAYWIIEDVLTTVEQVNADSTSVLDAPAKRLMHASFVLKERRRPRGGRRSRSRNSEDNVPKYVTSLENALTDPCTGRLTNEDWDVVQFNLSVIVNADAVQSFEAALCSGKEHIFKGWDGQSPAEKYVHNQISILESTITAIDTQDADHFLYRYGPNAVAELNLICEYLFNKAAYDTVKPQQVKDELAGVEEN